MSVWLMPLPFITHAMCFARFAELLVELGVSVSLFLTKTELELLKVRQATMLERWKVRSLNIEVRVLDSDLKIALAVDGGDTARFLGPFAEGERLFGEILKNTDCKPTCVIADYCTPFAREASEQLGVPTWLFLTVSTSCATACVYLDHLESEGLFDLPSSREDVSAQEIISVPGLSALRILELPQAFFKVDPAYDPFREAIRSVNKADVILLSSFRELDPGVVDSLEKLLRRHATRSGKKSPRVWPVGPLILDPSSGSNQDCADGTENVCVQFLRSCPPGSVVYVSFGTDVSVSRKQLEELVYGLGSTGHPFLCVVHPVREDPLKNGYYSEEVLSMLPPDLVSRIKDRSCFAKWSPQLQVLSHPSIGAFISHCGQNSVMESVSFGVPVLAWPWQYEQFINSRYLVDESKIALEICPDLRPGGLVNREDIARSVNILFHSDEGTQVRRRVKEMKQKADESVEEGGSSTRNRQALVQLIKNLESEN